MILQRQWKLVTVGLVRQALKPIGWPPEFDIILYQDSIMKNCHPGRLQESPCLTEARSAKIDVVTLPFTWRTAYIEKRGILSVNRSSLPIGIGRVLVRIENLDFISTHQVDSTVTSTLTFTNHGQRCRPFDVQLDIPKPSA
jgi:hypothetical protein